MTFRVRRVGDSLVLTVPKSFNVELGAVYTAEIKSNGIITYRPAHKNPFEGNWFKNDIKQTDDITEDDEILDNVIISCKVSEWLDQYINKALRPRLESFIYS